MKRSKILIVVALAVVLSILAIAIPVAPVVALTGNLSVTPSSGSPGTQVTISGASFTPNVACTVFFDLFNPTSQTITKTGVLNIQTDTNGAFVTSYTIPSGPAGLAAPNIVLPYHFEASTAAGDNSTSVSFAIIPAISFSTSTGKVGDPINVGGKGFQANATVKVYIDSNVVMMPSTDNSGIFSASFNVPESAQGKHTLHATDPLVSTNNFDFTVNPKISVNQTATTVGSQVTVSGTGFTAFSTITFSLDNVGVSSTASATNLGTFTNVQLTIPAVAAGSHTLKASDNGGFSDTATITTSQSLTTNPSTGPANTVITVAGGGFTANKTITVSYKGSPVVTTPSTVTSDAGGNFTATFAAPKTAAGTYEISVSDGSVSSTGKFTLTATAKVEQTSGAVGSSVPFSGNGFNSNTDITLKYDNVGVGTAKSDATGSFSGNFTVPPGLAGLHKIAITDGVNTVNADFTTTAAAQISGPSGSGTQTGGYVSSEVNIKGSAFTAGATVTVTYDSTSVATTTVATDGSFSVSFKAPPSKGGNHPVVASDGTNKLTFTYAMDSTPPPAPTLAAPAKDTNAPALPSFQWAPVTDPSGITYTLQVARDSGFNSIVVQKTGLTTTSYQLTEQEKLDSTGGDKPYYWRVKSIDGASNESPYSTALTFTVGFIMPTWLLYFLYFVGAVIVFAIGFFVGKRTSRYGA